MTNRSKAYLALLINTILWGMASPIIKHGLNLVSPLYFLTYRFIFVFILITPVFFVYVELNKIKIYHWRQLLTIGFLSTPVNLFLLFIGLQLTSSLDAAVLASLTPIFFCLFGHWFLNEKVSRQELAGVSIALLGTLFFVLQPLLDHSSSNQSSLLGNVIILIGQLFYIWAMILSKKEVKKNNPFVQSYVAFVTALLFFLPLALITKTINPLTLGSVFHSPSLWPIGYMAVFGSLVAFMAYLYGQSLIETSEASVFTYLQPLFAIPLSVWWLGEKITPAFLVGCILIAIGVFVAESRKKLL
jgi:drug/metabolite transporter (DMT)-like permease